MSLKYYVDLSINTIPGYIENDINNPAGWEDFKVIKDSIIDTNEDIVWCFKGEREDNSYIFEVSNKSHTILTWDDEVIPWKLKISDVAYTQCSESLLYIFDGIIQFNEIKMDEIPSDNTGFKLTLFSSYVKCNKADFDTAKSLFFSSDSVFICDQFMTVNNENGIKGIRIDTSIIDTGVSVSDIRLNTSSELSRSVFTSATFFNNVDIIDYGTNENFGSIPISDCTFGWTPPLWPDYNGTEQEFDVAILNLSRADKYSFKEVTINNSNCDRNNIFIISRDDTLNVFSNNDYKYTFSKYKVNSEGQLVHLNDKFYDNGTYIIDDVGQIIGDVRHNGTSIDFVSIMDDDTFLISGKEAVINFNQNEEFQMKFINRVFSSSDIFGPLIGNITVNKDLVSFRGNIRDINGINITSNPLSSISQFYNNNIDSVVVTKIDEVKIFQGFDKETDIAFRDELTDELVHIQNGLNDAIINYDGSTHNISDTRILGACFFGTDLFYVKTKKDNSLLVTDDNYHIISFPVLCSLKYGELIDFNIRETSGEVFLNNFTVFEEYVRFKNIKIINGKLVILFENHNPVYIDESLKSYTEYKSKYGIISSLDYVNGMYIVGVVETILKKYSQHNLDSTENFQSNGTHILKGPSLTDLHIVETCPVRDIVVDKFRKLIYISTIYEFKVYDYSMHLIKIYTINPTNMNFYSDITIKSRFMINGDINDVRKMIGYMDEIYPDKVSFNDSVTRDNQKIVSTSNKNGLTTTNSKTISMNKSTEIPNYADMSKVPLFSNNLNGLRTKDTFSIFSKDENSGVVVELSYDNNLIVIFPNTHIKHNTRRTIISSGIIPVSGEVPYDNIGICVKGKYILMRVKRVLTVYIIDEYDGSTTVAGSYTLTSSVTSWPEVLSFIIIGNKMLIPYNNTSIIEMILVDDTAVFSRNITTMLDSVATKTHQLEIFNNIPICIHSTNDIGYVGILITDDPGNLGVYNIVPVESTKLSYVSHDNTSIPFIKINKNNLSVFYADSILLSFDKQSFYGNKFADKDIQFEVDKLKPTNLNTLSLTIDNESLRNSKNRHFIKDSLAASVESYKNMFESQIGLVRDFDSNIIYTIVNNFGGHIIISDGYTDRKRIDIGISMDVTNPVKTIKTDNYDVIIDEVLYPKISAYLKDVTDSNLNNLCMFILQ